MGGGGIAELSHNSKKNNFYGKMFGPTNVEHIFDHLLYSSQQLHTRIIITLKRSVHWHSHIILCDPPSSGIASCVGTFGTVTWRLHLTQLYCVALGWVLIWVVSPHWFEEQNVATVFEHCCRFTPKPPWLDLFHTNRWIISITIIVKYKGFALKNLYF